MPRYAPLWLRLAWREIRGNTQFSAIFVVNLSLGLMGFVALDAFRSSVTTHLDDKSKVILGADLTVNARRAFTDEEERTIEAKLPAGGVTQRQTSFFSMVLVGAASRLVEVRAVDARFPFYGSVSLERGGEILPDVEKVITRERVAWVYPELLLQLKAKIGSELKLGAATFKIVDTIKQDPSLSTVGVAAAPRIFIGEAFLPDTELLKTGSRIFHSRLVKLPLGVDGEEVGATLKAALGNPELRVRTHKRATEELNRMTSYLGGYLGLVALVALFLTGIGAAYLYRGFIQRRCRDIAILKSLGASAHTTRLIFVAQLLTLGTVATVLVTLLAQVAMPALPRALKGVLPHDLVTAVPLSSIALAWLMGTGGSLLACLPLLAAIKRVSPAALFQESVSPTLETSSKSWLWWLPGVFLYWILAVSQARSFIVGSAFVLGLTLAGGLLILIGRAALALPTRLAGAKSLPLRLASLNLTRQRAATLSAFLAIGLCALLLNLIPQVRAVLDQEISPPEKKRPSLFLVDIQEEQVQGLTALLGNSGSELSYLSPMIRARLTAINGTPTGTDDKTSSNATREEEEEGRAQNRGLNLSYRERQAPSETIVEGRAFTERWSAESGKSPEISLEVRFADRIRVGLADRLTFDIQGVSTQGVVTSLRRVRWSSFEPNFFVQFQPGALDDAPKTFVAAIPELSLERKVALQNAMVSAFPNVSIIDIAATMTRIVELINQISTAVLFMALMTLAAGFAVLYAIAKQKSAERRRDTALLKVLGLSFGALRRMVATEFFLLGALASIPGAAIGVGAAFVVSYLDFDGAWTFDPIPPVAITAAISLMTSGLGLLAARRALSAKAITLLDATRQT